MESYFSAELHRSLALFITYSLHKPIPPSKLQKKKSLRFNGFQQPSASSDNLEVFVSSTTVGIEMLRMYCSFLCNANDLSPLKRFARAVTNKVCVERLSFNLLAF